jgi:antitoxin (DNA-binding transcriptional repressor) of toxin-antitoxin stability system
MGQTVSKAKFKAQALAYFRQVENMKKPLVITDRGRPVLQLIAYVEDPDAGLKELRGTVVQYADPTEPVGAEEWDTPLWKAVPLHRNVDREGIVL